MRDVELRLGDVCALIGEPGSGKSNLLAAIRALLDPHAPALTAADRTRGRTRPIGVDGQLADGARLRLGDAIEPPPAVLFLPGDLRTASVVAEPAGAAAVEAAERITAARRRAERDSTAGPAASLVDGLESCCSGGVAGVVMLVEEPELYLRPHAQRYLYRLLRRFAHTGNQVVYSTHSPAFLNVTRLNEIAVLRHHPRSGTTAFQPRPLPVQEEERALEELDMDRSELALARAAILVEGRTEKVAFPFVFRALGHDADREAVSIVDCGGKANLPLMAGICHALGVPAVVVHDRDVDPGRREPRAVRILNEEIGDAAGAERTVVLAPDFEGVVGIRSHAHKPQHALERFSALTRASVPAELARVVALALELAAQ